MFRSVACLVVELLTGEPPYFSCPPMAAMFRIVSEDHPDLPPKISSVKGYSLFSFLMGEVLLTYNEGSTRLPVAVLAEGCIETSFR